jgi:hypothetical protein
MRSIVLLPAIIVSCTACDSLTGEAQDSFQRGLDLYFGYQYERAIAAFDQRQSQHVGANHLHVHLLESSPTPARALASAKRLETLVPDAGHLLHMPSHIYLRLGDYRRAVTVNQRAFAADKAYPAHHPAGTDAGLQTHTSEFLAAAASFTGQSAVARAANDNLFVLMRFGLWDEILSRSVPERLRPVGDPDRAYPCADRHRTSGRG